MPATAVAVALAAAGALLAAMAVVLQRVALESAPASSSLSPRLMGHVLRMRGWLVGFGLLLATFAVRASALRFGQLSVVQPVLTTELVFLVIILGVVFHRAIGWRELAGIGAIVAGLAGFFASASPASGSGQPDSGSLTVVSAAVAVGALGLVLAGRSGPRWWRATALGAASAVLFAYNAALTKIATTLLHEGGWADVFGSWEPYVIAVCGATGLFLVQGALHAGPITASRTASVIINPLVSITIGVLAFGEQLRAGAGFVALQIAAILVMCAGVVVLVRSPLVAGLAGESGDEYLSAAAVDRSIPPGA